MDDNPINSQPFTSVIIPVYNNLEALKICLSALSHQTYGQENYEVIVVDNGSDQPIAAILEKQFPSVKFISETEPGSYVARNTGIDHANGEMLAFTDSDCIPHSDWLERGIETFVSTPNCGLVAGNIIVKSRVEDQPNTYEKFEQVFSFSQFRSVKQENFGSTSNVITSKAVINKVGKFRPELKSRGDKDWGNRISSAGLSIVYDEKAAVDHPARATFRDVYIRAMRIEGGQYTLEKLEGKNALSNIKSIASNAKPPVRLVYFLLRDSRIPSISQRVKMLALIVALRYGAAWERLRLSFGAPARRK